MRRLEKIYRFLLYILPGVLFFLYWPVIALGSSESMNFELSLPLIWLVIFDVVALVVMWRKRLLFKGLKGKWWLWVLFPVWLSLSVLWSLNFVRGFLTVGILWLLYLAAYGIWRLRELGNEEFRRRWWKWFFGTALVACGWCILQCVLDLAGVPREYSLMCKGCTYKMFGFPHPNGFAIEPQFMGNLLLAPTIVMAWLILKDDHNSTLRGRGSSLPSLRGSDPSFLGRNLRKPLRILLLVVFSATLFLTFSRGAIYAFGVAMVFMVAYTGVRQKSWKVLQIFAIIAVAFVLALNLQGVMAAVSPTNDTYFDGVAKAVNHLSLGVIDIRGGEKQESDNSPAKSDDVVVEKPVDNFEENGGEEAVFDGYVAESTDTRVRLTGAALTVWRKDVATALFGVGLGGAGQALYVNGLSPAPKEIVQNQYASLLLETGLVGVSLFVLTIVLVVWAIWKRCLAGMGAMLALLVAYGVSLLFFSGLANALQIYLIPTVLYMVLRKKLVS